MSTRGRLGLRLAPAWNVLGLLALANVVTRAVVTTPGPFNPLHAEVPNLMMSTFPFLFIPGFFVPLAVLLHVLALRAISSRPRTATSGAVSSDRARPLMNGSRTRPVAASSKIHTPSSL